MKYFRPEVYANATLSPQVLCCKHDMPMYLDEYLTKICLRANKKMVLNTPSQNPKFLELRCNIFHIIEPWYGISNNVVCATSKASYQPAHTRSLIRAFASRLNIL